MGPWPRPTVLMAMAQPEQFIREVVVWVVALWVGAWGRESARKVLRVLVQVGVGVGRRRVVVVEEVMVVVVVARAVGVVARKVVVVVVVVVGVVRKVVVVVVVARVVGTCRSRLMVM